MKKSWKIHICRENMLAVCQNVLILMNLEMSPRWNEKTGRIWCDHQIGMA